jgi:hypothetical protein
MTTGMAWVLELAAHYEHSDHTTCGFVIANALCTWFAAFFAVCDLVSDFKKIVGVYHRYDV